MKIHFYLDRKTSSGKSAVYCYVRESKETLKMNTRKAVEPELWNSVDERANLQLAGKNNKLKGTLKNVNAVLDKFQSVVEKIEGDIRKDDPASGFDVIIDSIKKHFDKRETGFLNIYDKFLETKKSVYTEKHLYKFQSLKNVLKDFQQSENEKLTFIKITPAFFEKFFSYLVNDKGLLSNSAHKQISFLKTFLIWCNDNSYCNNLSYRSFKAKTEQNDVIYLAENELMKLYNLMPDDLHPFYEISVENDKTKKINRDTLLKARDLFCFQCFTGARFGDVQNITSDDVKGPLWKLHTQKTKQIIDIPLNDFALSILQKYSEYPQPLPVMTNQKINLYLKILCEAAGINEPVKVVKFKGTKREERTFKKYELIATHTARRTFVSLSLMKGMSPETIMRITGHSDYKMMKKYLKIADQHVKDEMFRTWGSPLKLVNNPG